MAESYFLLILILLTIVGLISFVTGLAMKKKILWIIGLIVALACGAFVALMFFMQNFMSR